MEYDDEQEMVNAQRFITEYLMPKLDALSDDSNVAEILANIVSSDEFKIKLKEYELDDELIKDMHFNVYKKNISEIAMDELLNDEELVNKFKNSDNYQIACEDMGNMKVRVFESKERLDIDDVEPINQEAFDRMMKL